MKLNLETFIKRSKDKHNNKFTYDKTEYKYITEKLLITCKIHGDFLVYGERHLISNFGGCKKCLSENRKIIKFNSILEKLKRKFNDKFDYSKVQYSGWDKPVKIICKKHGEFEQTIKFHLNNKNGCKHCYFESKRLTQDQFLKRAKNIFPKYDYSNSIYIDYYKKIKITCLEHGEFITTPHTLICGKHGCRSCGLINSSRSKSSDRWLKQFKNENIINEYYIKKLKIFVDGYDPFTNTIYEFDGDYWHGNPKIYDQNDFNNRCKKTFGELYQSTLKRQENIKNLGYNFISIWASDFKQHELFQKGLCVNADNI